MNKKNIITILLALVAIMGQAQTKTATITGYSPALKDGTVAESSIDNVRVASDTIIGGHFTLTVPVEGLTKSYLFKFCLFHKLNFGGTMVRGCGGAVVRRCESRVNEHAVFLVP